ncbi:ATP-binding cassette domain-containing protein, partial [Tabrizicola sp.]|uniref:ATP-binding cassette domain-containing protein n=1 Tax=Tabrizicola sp. TaxID=2005166 RepID=UPI0025D85F4C
MPPPSSPPPIVALDRLTQRFEDRTIVDALTFSIAEGEVFGFLGHNGAGKTTTLNMLTTLARPASGTATIAGADLVRDPDGVRRNIGFVPENVRLYDTLTAEENLLFFARLSGVTAPARRVREVLELLDSLPYAGRRVGGFSKGMRQRIGLAQAILHKPKVL